MNLLLIITSVLFGLILLLEWVLLMRVVRSLRQERQIVLLQDDRLPRVSILIAARNEEDKLPSLLQSLDKQDYQRQLFEVIIADDQSEDGTWPLLQVAQKRYPWLSTIQVPEGHQPIGKQGALALLSSEAKGHIWLYLDADCLPPPIWAREMVSRMEYAGADLLSGTTIVEGKGLLASLQQTDWMQALAMLHTAAAIDKPLTLLGNNFGFRRKAYQKTGGWAKLSPSMTEDYVMFRVCQDKGLNIVQTLSPAPVVTQAAEAEELYQQRKRWLSASVSVPFIYQLVMILRWFKLPLLVTIALAMAWQVAAGIALIHWVTRRTMFGMLARHMQRTMSYPGVLFFGLYELLLNGVSWLGLLLRPTVRWKGRKYRS